MSEEMPKITGRMLVKDIEDKFIQITYVSPKGEIYGYELSWEPHKQRYDCSLVLHQIRHVKPGDIVAIYGDAFDESCNGYAPIMCPWYIEGIMRGKFKEVPELANMVLWEKEVAE